MKRRALITIPILAACSTALLIATAASGQETSDQKPGTQGQAAAQAQTGAASKPGSLALTDDQRAKMRTLREQHLGELRTAQDQVRAARDKFQEARRNAGPDEKALRVAAGVLATAEADLMVLRARQQAQLTGVLTPEQRAAAQQRRAAAPYASRGFSGWRALTPQGPYMGGRGWRGMTPRGPYMGGRGWRGMTPQGPYMGGRGWRNRLEPWWWGPAEPGGPPPRPRRRI